MVKRIKKKKNNWYKYVISFILVILTFVIGVFAKYKYVFNFDDRKAIFDFIQQKYRKLDASIIDIKDYKMTIMTLNDSIYTINYNNDDLNIGDDVRFFYEGDIDILREEQNIIIKDVRGTDLNLNYSKSIIDIVNEMSLEEKIGQLFLVRVPSYDKDKVINDYHIGGYILFSRDVLYKSKQGLKDEITHYQSLTEIPLIIAIDEEGGTVSRLSANYNIVSKPFKSPRSLYNTGGMDAIRDDGVAKVTLLRELGINMNLAPVVDIVTSKNAFMYDRSLGLDKDKTSEFAKTVLSTQTNDMSYVLKHFPGYGNNVDTHKGIAIDNREYKEFVDNDFIPFKTGIDNGTRAILVSHNIVKCMDDVPASISRISHNVLRSGLNFDGVIITDDLDMNGLMDYNRNPYLNAVLAGNNILIVSDYKKAFNSIYEAVKNEIISDTLIDRLVMKNLKFKELYVK